ncbi:hypothetical protein DR864_28600 (plasmid) [Runella rosea]|uniref:IraD/Gp25-like domain-containing protein n=1 Tax=Runella rosea TaxID=2259595 RepID=A0A344TT62_9BACT|nr:GPW/gp25 family protein [Runella rosea]AXE21833.1 hypothetical protein DR864_28600 [Runella rosea]
MSEGFYPIPPSFGALMKQQGSERNFVEEVRSLHSYDEITKRFGGEKNLEAISLIAKLLASLKLASFQELRQRLTFRELVEYLVEGTIIQKISLEESITQNITLYLSSKPKEFYFDRAYGCIVHNYDFRQLNDTPSKDQLKRTISEYLQKFENRITVNTVSIDINDVQESVEGSNPRICRYIIITIASTLVQTQERLKEMKFRLVRYS